MINIGTTPIALWEKVQDIAKKQTYPERQPPNCPYVILKKVNNNQLLALSGMFSKQAIDLYIIEVQSPNTTPKNRERIDETYWNEAHVYANELLKRAVESSQLTPSISKQPGMKQKGANKRKKDV